MASTALPPRSSMRKPASTASGFAAATMYRFACASFLGVQPLGGSGWGGSSCAEAQNEAASPKARASRLKGPSWRSDTAHRQVLDLQEVVDAVFRALAAQARLFHAAEGRDLGGDEAGVDADDPGLERLGHAPHASHVARVEIRGEPELGVVGLRDHVLLVAEAEERRDRAERLLGRHFHVL